MRIHLLALGGLSLLAACTPAVDESMINQMEEAVSEGLSAQGEVKEVELTKENDDRMTGFAVIEPREAPGTEARFDCTAERQGESGTQFSWRCNPATQSADAGSTTTIPANASKDPAAGAIPAAAPLASLDRVPYVGRWTDIGDCSQVTVLGADGVFITANGARGNWDVRGDQFTLSGANGSATWTVRLDDPNTLTLTSADGTSGRSTRC